MFKKNLFKGIINHRSFLNIFMCVLICFFCSIVSVPAQGQIFPYSSNVQSYFSFFSNPYFNPYSSVTSANWGNPFIGLYNPFPTFNNFSSFNGTPYYPQASIAGGLVPFAAPYANPFVLPYNAAAAYFAAAVTPADVAGSWAGTWVSTFLAGGVITGEISMTLTQNGTEVAGTAVFLLNKILKYGAYVVGTVEGNTLTLTSSVVTSVTGTMVFDVEIVATVTDIGMEGSYVVISLATGLVSEEGTFIATRL
ncbi:MAG: hypothetical protein ACMUIM_02830 [bacterium]